MQPPADPTLRASDLDRGEVVADLWRHADAGRLDEAEFDARVAAAMAAVTLGDLAVVVRDLPPLPPDPARADDEPVAWGLDFAHPLVLAFGLAAVTIAVLAAVLAGARP